MKMCAALVLLAATTASGQTVQMLSSLGGTESIAWDINDNGVIVGQSQLAGDTITRAAQWNGGSVVDLGGAFAGESSVAYAVNNGGEVVGFSSFFDDSQGFEIRDATYWDDRGGVTNLARELGAQGNSTAWDINNNGLVVGQMPIAPGFAKGFVWENGEGGQAAGTVPGYNGGANLGTNDNGLMVGHSFFFGDPNRATLSFPDGRGGYLTAEIGPPGFVFSVASAINNNDMVVGHTNLGMSDWNACIFNPDPLNPVTMLGTLDGLGISEAHDVNDDGLIVGHAFDGTGAGLDPRAWAWRDGVMYDLNSFLSEAPEFEVLLQATGVNNHGDIVGFGRTFEGELRGFVIEGFVPAPGTAGAFALAGLAAARRRRR